MQKAVSTYIDGIISDTGDAAMICGAQIADVASAMGITRQGVQKRWGRRARGWMKAAVVIFRPDSSYEFVDDSGRSFGEVGVPDQYDSDRGWWLIGKEVRARARYAVVGVNGTVQRVYEIDADSWIRSENGKWQFRAVDDRPLTEEEIPAAYATGYLPLVPGNSCQTHPRAAYRPHWFP
ncbi:hypothetical protein AB0H00_12970 [Nocardia sp. NPDC023852]|uniref:hypothetical protein n=1 Tax=Nocardia sp. NPDC023852 TaxID=3154697 RepID=UPI0033C891E6